jgi:hypothetical protein
MPMTSGLRSTHAVCLGPALAIAALALACGGAASEERLHHQIVPMSGPSPEHGVERVWGEPDVAGAPYVIRIHNDAGFVVLPHTHPEDEHIVVIRGSWWLGMGPRADRGAWEPLELGAYGFVPARMPHFAWSETATTLQVHGIGPFSTDVVDPVYQLHAEGVSEFDVAWTAWPTRRRAGGMFCRRARCACQCDARRGHRDRRPLLAGQRADAVSYRAARRRTLLGHGRGGDAAIAGRRCPRSRSGCNDDVSR